MRDDQTPSRIWTLDRDHVDAVVRSSHQSRKTMVTAFFGVDDIGLVKILPDGTKLTSGYFKDEVLRQIYQESYASSDLDCPIPLTVHGDNASVTMPRESQKDWQSTGSFDMSIPHTHRMSHRAISSDLAIFGNHRSSQHIARKRSSKRPPFGRSRTFRGRLCSMLLRVGGGG
jgi:hypothetical protein